MRREVRKIFFEFGIKNPIFKLNNNYNKIGLCYNNGTFEISGISFRYNNYRGRKALIGHEIAHLKEFNHGKKFNEVCNKMGINEKEMLPMSRYILFCPKCKNWGRLNVLKKKQYFCKSCEKQEVMVYQHKK
tara:strand:- start:53 stop:445 length:393 start_codon:yes stop_codon:yes gene_type:complete